MNKSTLSGHYWFDISLILTFLLFLIIPKISFEMKYILTPFFFSFLGILFSLSNKFKAFSYIERGLYWVSQNVMIPRTKYNHLLIGMFMFIIATGSALFTDVTDIEDNKLLWDELSKDPFFWISIFVILGFNLLIGFYRFKKLKKDKRR